MTETHIEQKKGISLTPRLMKAAEYARCGRKIADIGTDHAYLPIYLVSNGISSSAVACDVKIGPLSRASDNIFEYRLESKIQTLLTDGLHGVDNFAPDDIFICGMGGELISTIISECDYVRAGNVRLILQPMTHADFLRIFLSDNGFRIVDEDIVSENNRKIYQIIVAEYSGEPYKLTEAEKLIGPINIKKKSVLLNGFVRMNIKTLKNKADGLKTAGQNIDEISELIGSLDLICGE